MQRFLGCSETCFLLIFLIKVASCSTGDKELDSPLIFSFESRHQMVCKTFSAKSNSSPPVRLAIHMGELRSRLIGGPENYPTPTAVPLNFWTGSTWVPSQAKWVL